MGCNGGWDLRAYVSGARLLQRSLTVAPTRGLQRGVGFEGLRIRGGGASTVVDRASPVFSADEDVHNPSGDEGAVLRRLNVRDTRSRLPLLWGCLS